MNALHLIPLISSDSGLSAQEKNQLSELLRGKDIDKLLSGIAGSAVLAIASKYMKLGRTAQVLLGLAGFGLGRIVYDYVTKHHKHFANWNDQSKAYEINKSYQANG